MREYIQKIRDKENLARQEIEAVMQQIMSGQAVKEEMADFLLALREKGPTVEELTGAARIMRKFVIGVSSRHKVILDTCGTGGDKKNTFNISTVSAFVVAGAGVPVAKHGNRSVSSACGSACVLEALGVRLDIEEQRLEECLNEIGIVFLFAQRLHPAMRNIAAVRRELGVDTIFNILGPLTNPARATHQVIGVYNRDLLEPVARVLKNLGSRRALVVHGGDGLDEITLTDQTFVCSYDGTQILSYDITPEELGFVRCRAEDLQGGDVEQNARIAREILEGQPGPKRDVVVLNAAYALYTAEKAESLNDALAMARDSIDSGAAKRKLEALKAFTRGERL